MIAGVKSLSEVLFWFALISTRGMTLDKLLLPRSFPRHSTSVKRWVSRFFQKEEKVVEESEYLRIMLEGDLESHSKPK